MSSDTVTFEWGENIKVRNKVFKIPKYIDHINYKNNYLKFYLNNSYDNLKKRYNNKNMLN